MFQKNNTVRILNLFLKEPNRKFQLRELSRLTELSTTAVKSSLVELSKERLIAQKREKKYVFFESNRNKDEYKLIKKFFSVISLKESGLLDFLDSELNHPEAIILFGSAARGEDTEKSDIDIFVLTEKKKEVILKDFEKKLKKSIKVLLLSGSEFNEAKNKNPELINNIANGMILKGYLEVI